jgi:hypothetical protein
LTQPIPIEIPEVNLDYASVDDHCNALRKINKAFFWWYMGAGNILWNFTLPFQDGDGRWWYQVKPGFCWPVDFLSPFKNRGKMMPLSKSFLGYQHILEDGEDANSKLIINVIDDLADVWQGLDCRKRQGIRKGANNCELALLTGSDYQTITECAEVWKNITARTGWKRPISREKFLESWGYFFEIPGVSVIVGRERKTGKVAGFMVTKIIGDTAYIDTIAASTEMLNTRINDLIMHSFIRNVARHKHVKKVHCAIMSYKSSLEKFKRGHGFTPYPYRSYTSFKPGVGTLIKTLMPMNYNRMTGKMEIEEHETVGAIKTKSLKCLHS